MSSSVNSRSFTIQPRTDGPTALDLFSGAGGLSLGLRMAGGTPLGAVDFDSDSIATFRQNFPSANHTYCGSIEDWTPDAELDKVDVVIGGPPCQGFSLARGTRFVDDPRNTLYKHFVRTVEHVRPQWFVMENVEGILNIAGGAIRDQIFEDFARAGYVVQVRVVNMADFGVPQRRRRAIFVGSLAKRPFIWPAPSHVKHVDHTDPQLFNLPRHVSVNDAIGDLGAPIGRYFAHRANSQMRGPRNRLADTEPAFTLRVRGDEFALCEHPATSAFAPGPRPLEPSRARRVPANDFQRLMQSWRSHGSTSVRTPRNHDKPSYLEGTRRLSLREQARIQSFPDSFNFLGSVTSQAKQIGNAVPPLFAMKLFEEISRQSG